MLSLHCRLNETRAHGSAPETDESGRDRRQKQTGTDCLIVVCSQGSLGLAVSQPIRPAAKVRAADKPYVGSILDHYLK